MTNEKPALWPSNAERAEWSDRTTEYVEWLEAELGLALNAFNAAVIEGSFEAEESGEHQREKERLRAENKRLREACNQSRLAFAGLVSAQSAIDMLDALNAEAHEQRTKQ